jgi:formylglycine-generating enzyme required for sulfatase activity
VNRGGSFNNAASNARSANRNNNTPENQNNTLGLRPAKASQRSIARE